ncbi:DUF2894 domain-containing protein [Paraburkholderia sp. BCC1886]|uniref:DUF2894 domain-containing protein n=1 Tax=Paraburkholderia sp. BCC1886 TaxID=2562670 RepID=UPI0021B2B3D4|nr:DUF2894 domain-containing protein [Paraburkholderia sp. BCC1886]
MNSGSDAREGVEASARGRLDAWRACGADRLDPVRFHFMDALERRAAGHTGALRGLLDERLSTLLDEYAEVVAGNAIAAESPASPDEKGPGPLGGLTRYIANNRPASTSSSAYPELAALDYFREVWSRVRAEQQFQQALEQVPGNAGPLNSSSLVHRSLSLMRELSPGYLKHFLAYTDALSWMEQINGAAAPVKDTPRAASSVKNAVKSPAKSARGKSR